MSKNIAIMIFFICGSLHGQPPMDRYNTELFSSVTETNDILFSASVPQPTYGGGWWEWVTSYPLNADETYTENIDLYMDVFEPSGDTLSNRPLIIICFGGGFLSGSKDHWSIRLLCEGLAKRGYVTAAIDYRLGMNIFDSDLANRAVYRGLQDGRAAVSYFRSNAAGTNTYRIDPNQIFLGGHSSGAFIATHNAYLDKESERPLSTGVWMQDGEVIPDLGTLDDTVMNPGYSGEANAIFSLAGAIGFLSFMESEENKKCVMFHSDDDDTVPFDEGEPFSGVLWIVPGSDLPIVYGSSAMATRADEINLAHEFYPYTMSSARGHSVHENGNSVLYDNIVPDINEWFFEEELKPLYENISGPTLVCNASLLESYTAMGTKGIYFEWEVIGGQLIDDNNTEQVKVLWDSGADTHQLLVTPFSKSDARGELISIDVNISNMKNNQFIGLDEQWYTLSNWSLGILPDRCTNVQIKNNVELTVDISIELNSLEIFTSGNLMLSGDLFWINQKDNSFNGYTLTNRGTLNNEGTLKVENVNDSKCLLNITGVIENTGIVRLVNF